jgi:hypothetical protein
VIQLLVYFGSAPLENTAKIILVLPNKDHRRLPGA